MVSALNPQAGCAQTPIQGYGPAGAPLTYRRVTGTVTAQVAKKAGYKAPPNGVVQAVEELAIVGVVAAGAVAAGWVLVTVAGPLVAWSMSRMIRKALR